MGILFKPKASPTPSWGTPSIKIFTCLPVKPSSIIDISEPTPPDSRNFSPGVRANASLTFFVEFCRFSVPIATALKADRFTRLTPLAIITTSSNCTSESDSTMFIFCRSPTNWIGFSTVS